GAASGRVGAASGDVAAAATAAGIEPSPGTGGRAASRPRASTVLVTEKASIVLRSLRFMMAVLLWWIGVVSNYNTRTGIRKCFRVPAHPTKDRVGTLSTSPGEKSNEDKQIPCV